MRSNDGIKNLTVDQTPDDLLQSYGDVVLLQRDWLSLVMSLAEMHICNICIWCCCMNQTGVLIPKFLVHRPKVTLY